GVWRLVWPAAIVLAVRTNRAQIGDDGPPGAIFVIGQIDGIDRPFDPSYFRKPHQFRADHVRWAAELPRVGHVTDQLPLIGVTGTGINPDLLEIIGRTGTEVRRQDLTTYQYITARGFASAVVRDIVQDASILIQLTDSFY